MPLYRISNILLKKSLDKEANDGGKKREGVDVFHAKSEKINVLNVGNN